MQGRVSVQSDGWVGAGWCRTLGINNSRCDQRTIKRYQAEWGKQGGTVLWRQGQEVHRSWASRDNRCKGFRAPGKVGAPSRSRPAAHRRGCYRGWGQAEPWEALTGDLSEGVRGCQESGCQRQMTVAFSKGRYALREGTGVDGSEKGSCESKFLSE